MRSGKTAKKENRKKERKENGNDGTIATEDTSDPGEHGSFFVSSRSPGVFRTKLTKQKLKHAQSHSIYKLYELKILKIT